MRPGILLLLLFPAALRAQTKEQLLDHNYRPVAEGYNARYVSITEPKDGRWHRELFYIKERSLAFSGDFLDSGHVTREGTHHWFHPNKMLSRVETFRAGKLHGPYLRLDEKGRLRDSSNYENGYLKGVSLGWNEEGSLTDSASFDGAGNGVRVHWYGSGAVYSAGRISADTARTGRWKYYHENGQTLADVVYENDRIRSCRCFDTGGAERDSASCAGREAKFPGGAKGWRTFLEENLTTPAGVGAGRYVVYMRFVVDKDGRLYDFVPLTSLGHGFEEEVERLLRKSPRWVPARQFGRPLKAYRTQPVTFVISE